VGIGTIVRVESDVAVEGRRAVVYGVVTEAEAWTDVPSVLTAMLDRLGDPAAEPDQQRAEIRLYAAQVLRQIPDEPLQPVPMGRVHLATDDDIALALRMDAYLRADARTGIPVGVYRTGNLVSPVYLDADFLVGAEAAHLNITGVSGLATKTSAVEWLLASVFAHFPASKGSVAAERRGTRMDNSWDAGTSADARAMSEGSAPLSPSTTERGQGDGLHAGGARDRALRPVSRRPARVRRGRPTARPPGRTHLGG
jgi:hypothetical protein